MPIRVVFCGLCTPKHPDVYELLQQLRTTYNAGLEIVELECMAACDETPAVMIGQRYHPQMTVNALRQLLELHGDSAKREW
jgi:NADH:ubiquinone oxidoreductase subunit E